MFAYLRRPSGEFRKKIKVNVSFFARRFSRHKGYTKHVVMTFFAYFQGTLEKLDIQTETNNKLLAQQDKQQVSCTDLNCKRCCSVVLTCVDCISGRGQSTGTTGGPQNWTTREQLHMRATGTRLRRMPLWSVNLVSFQTINEFNALNSYRLRKSTLYQKNSMNQRPP